MAGQTETMLKTECRTELEEIMRILEGKTAGEQQKILVFLQGVAFNENAKKQ